MTTLHAGQALLPAGWARDVRLTLEGGRIAAIDPGVAARRGDARHACLLPGMPNLHSHAFQRAMAGRAERGGRRQDSFWSWRTEMYRCALAMTPDDVEAVAAQLYMEMLEAGFTRVGEFHYLHHGTDGQPYADIAEMATRVAAASAQAGIALTLLPVFYAHGNFAGAPPGAEQRRFVTDLDSFAALHARCATLAAALPGGVVGIAPHSLRAVTPDELAGLMPLAGHGPVHIHVAEQLKEVAECILWSKQRPVEWLLAHAPVDARWCLVHATHMTVHETLALRASRAVAGLCPITEANLGDGLFPAPRFLAAGGRFGVGSDSNVLIGLAEELRMLEYGQRLAKRARNVLAAAGRSTGRTLFEGALDGGGRALGEPAGLAVGRPADMVALRPRHDVPLDGDAVLDGWIFANAMTVEDVWVRGSRRVAGGTHVDRAAISARFARAMRGLAG